MNIPLLVYQDFSNTYISEIEQLKGNVTVIRHVSDAGELMGIAQTGLAKAALLIDVDEQITTSTLQALKNFGIAILVLEEHGTLQSRVGEKRLSTLASIEEVISAIETSVQELEGQTDLANVHEMSTNSLDSEQTELVAENSGAVLVFWGTAGAPGRSTLAIQLASLLADQDHKVCLIDADTYNPSLFAMLGLQEEYSTLAQLAHLAEHGSLDVQSFKQTVSPIRHRNSAFDIVTGITSAERWIEVRHPSFEKILMVAQQIYDFVVLDIHYLLELDEDLAYDGMAPRRNGCAISAIERADHLFVIGSGDVIGIPRMVQAHEQLLKSGIKLQEDAELHLWINKVRDSATGNSAIVQLENAWKQYQPHLEIEGYIPWEPEVFDKALLTGQTVRELGLSKKQDQLMKSLELMARPFFDKNRAEQKVVSTVPEQPTMIIQREHNNQKRLGLVSKWGKTKRR